VIVWCKLCETNPVDVHPDDALHESFDGATCEDCEFVVELNRSMRKFSEMCRKLASRTEVPKQLFVFG
jgi:hypothetical protein